MDATIIVKGTLSTCTDFARFFLHREAQEMTLVGETTVAIVRDTTVERLNAWFLTDRKFCAGEGYEPGSLLLWNPIGKEG